MCGTAFFNTNFTKLFLKDIFSIPLPHLNLHVDQQIKYICCGFTMELFESVIILDLK